MKGVKGCHARTLEGPVDPEVLARAALEEFSTRVQSARERPQPCMMCAGGGVHVGNWTYLWGHCCWGCGGSGIVMSGYKGLRGPFRAAPGRSTSVGGGS